MLNNFKAVSGFKVAVVAVLAGMMLLSQGCGAKYGTQTVKINYYQDCYQPIAKIRQDADARTRNTAAGAVVGGILGGVVGYQRGGGKGAAVGAVSGAVIGGAAAYLITDSVQKKDQAERFAAYSQALDQDIRGLQSAVAAARLTAKCYQNSYQALDKMYKAGKIGKEEMVARLTEIRDGTNDANTILQNFNAEVAENQLVYQDIRKAEAKRSQGLSQAQMKNMASKQGQLSSVSKEAEAELANMRRLTQLCDTQLKTITAQGPVGPVNMALQPLPVACPAGL